MINSTELLDNAGNGIVPMDASRSMHDDRFSSDDANNPGGLILSFASGMRNI